MAALLPVALLGALARIALAPATFTVARDAARALGTMAGMDMSGMSASATVRVERPGGRCTLSVCPILKPGPNELSVAGELGWRWRRCGSPTPVATWTRAWSC